MTSRDLDEQAGLPIRDEAMALSAVDGDDELAGELYALLCAGLPGELEELRARHAAADWSGLAEATHRLRGASRYCGVTALDQALVTLEALARTSGEASAIDIAVERVADEVRRLLSSAND